MTSEGKLYPKQNEKKKNAVKEADQIHVRIDVLCSVNTKRKRKREKGEEEVTKTQAPI